MRVFKCWFCSSNIYPGHGITFVRNDCKLFRFCRSKCHKNFKLKRNPRKVKWTKTHRRLAGKELFQDASLEFERHRNVPLRYDRQRMSRTIRVIKQLDNIRERRRLVHYQQRMQASKLREKNANMAEIRNDVKLISSALPLHRTRLMNKVKVPAQQINRDSLVSMKNNNSDDDFAPTSSAKYNPTKK